MNGRDLTLGLVGALAVGAALGRRRGSSNASELECDPNAPKILYHLTNKRRFVIDPMFVPEEAVAWNVPRDPELFVTNNPTYWLPWRTGPKHVAVLDVSRLCFGGYRSISRAGEERIDTEKARLAEERHGLETAAEAFKQSLMMDGEPMPERLRSGVMDLSAPGADPVMSFFANNHAFRERSRDSIEALVREGFATRASVERAERAIAQADRKIEDAKMRLSTVKSQVPRYDAHIPRDGAYPEYIIFPHAYDKVRVIETLPYKAAETKYTDRYGWRIQ
jgi:hypothetical protein